MNAADLVELKSLNNPPDVVINVLSAFFSVFNKNPNWDSIRKELKSPHSVLKEASNINLDDLPDEIVAKFENYNLEEWITLEYVKSKSKALVGIYNWLKTLVHFTQANKNVRKI